MIREVVDNLETDNEIKVVVGECSPNKIYLTRYTDNKFYKLQEVSYLKEKEQPFFAWMSVVGSSSALAWGLTFFEALRLITVLRSGRVYECETLEDIVSVLIGEID
jgi:hypothetical protein